MPRPYIVRATRVAESQSRPKGAYATANPGARCKEPVRRTGSWQGKPNDFPLAPRGQRPRDAFWFIATGAGMSVAKLVGTQPSPRRTAGRLLGD